jgi:hypothetical protein
VKEFEASLAKLRGRAFHGVRVSDLELDRCLRNGELGRPLLDAETRLCRLAQRPDAEVLAAVDLLAV